MTEVNKSYMRFPKPVAYTELGSQRQVKKISIDWGENWTTLTDKERKDLKRGQFAFGSLFPYVFDGLANVATHLGKDFFSSHEEYYRIEATIDDWCFYSLMGYEKYNREHFINELLRRGSSSDKDEAQHLRYVPTTKGKYISIQPLIIGFKKDTQRKIPPKELKKLMNLKTCNEHTKIINSVIIYVLKPLIDPIFNGHDGGWFSCPSALYAKINYAIQTPTYHEQAKEKVHSVSYYDLEALFLRKYFLYLNTQDGSQNTNYINVNAIDLWEHVSPAEIKVNGKYKYIRDWPRAKKKLEAANRFFEVMETRGLMEGAKAFPTVCPKSVHYHKDKQLYRIYYKRSPGITLKKKKLCPDLL
jgi:hypothetical protein